jgi:hypothetical protein
MVYIVPVKERLWPAKVAGERKLAAKLAANIGAHFWIECGENYAPPNSLQRIGTSAVTRRP